jgi:hypothetical protein
MAVPSEVTDWVDDIQAAAGLSATGDLDQPTRLTILLIAVLLQMLAKLDEIATNTTRSLVPPWSRRAITRKCDRAESGSFSGFLMVGAAGFEPATPSPPD